MPKNKLFDSWTWRRTPPAPFDDPDWAIRRTDVRSQYAPATAQSCVHTATLCGILAYMDLDHASELSGDPAKGAIGTQGDNFVVAEYPSHTGLTHIVVFNKTNGKFTAVKLQDGDDTLKPYSLKESGDSGAALFFALMPDALTDTEFVTEYEALWECKKTGYLDKEESCKHAAILCDNLYRRIDSPASCGTSGLPVNIAMSGNIQPFTKLNYDRGTYNPTSVILGDFQILKPGAVPSSCRHSTVNAKDFVGKYEFNPRTLTAQEEAMVPPLPAWYAIPEQIVTVCKHVSATTASLQPMRNLMFRGPAGTGKTEGVKAFAAGVHRPYVSITCNANFEIYDFLGQMMPDTASSSAYKAKLPSLQDIQMDPPSAYYELTGEYDEAANEDSVFDKLLEVMAAQAKYSAGHKSQSFHYVDTPLVRALRYGYVCEVQEPTVIANPGVLVGLNSLLDRCNSITLPTGEKIERHPDCVIVITTNTGYEGCRDMNQSVISRMNMVIDFDQPDPATMALRVSGITGCSDKGAIRQMVDMITEIAERCRVNMITDGSCGMRELIAWVQSYMVCGDFLESAKYTVLSSVSADPENREDILNSCLMPKFAP